MGGGRAGQAAADAAKNKADAGGGREDDSEQLLVASLGELYSAANVWPLNWSGNLRE